jgi:hypothetical protein
MSRIEGIVKDEYTEKEIEENIETLVDEGIINPDDDRSLVRIAREFYFRGLVHARAEEEKVERVRENFGY